MSITKVYENGSVEVAVPVNEKIAIFSDGPFEVYQLAGYPNLPSTWNLLSAVAAGTQYVSAAFSAAGTVRIDVGPSACFYSVGAAPVAAENNTSGNAALLGAGGSMSLPGGLAIFGATLVTAQASALTTQTLAALTTQSVSTLTTVDLSVLTSNPVVFLSTTQIAALQTTVNALATELEATKVNANKVVVAVPTLNTNNTALSGVLTDIGITA